MTTIAIVAIGLLMTDLALVLAIVYVRRQEKRIVVVAKSVNDTLHIMTELLSVVRTNTEDIYAIRTGQKNA